MFLCILTIIFFPDMCGPSWRHFLADTDPLSDDNTYIRPEQVFIKSEPEDITEHEKNTIQNNG